jgi:hypothetical protein
MYKKSLHMEGDGPKKFECVRVTSEEITKQLQPRYPSWMVPKTAIKPV